MDAVTGKAVGSIASAVFKFMLKIFWGKAYRSYLWDSCFKIAAKNSEFDQRVAIKLASAPALERLMNNTFRADRPVPTALDFAVGIAFELHDKEEFLGRGLSPDQIRYFAVGVRNQWLNGIISSPELQIKFESIRDVHAARFVGVDASCLSSENGLLSSYEELCVHYFLSYTTSDSTEVVRVWLPDEEGVISYNEDSRRIVEVKLNTSVGADRGFFRVGFDYSIERTGDRLHVCFLNTKTRMEAGHFGRYSIGRATRHVLWAR